MDGGLQERVGETGISGLDPGLRVGEEGSTWNPPAELGSMALPHGGNILHPVLATTSLQLLKCYYGLR
jgi:hypothetical protein